MEPTRKNYYAIIPLYILENRTLPAQSKILFALISSMMDSNNTCSFQIKQIADSNFDVDVESCKRWLDLLAKERHILIEYKIESEKEVCKVELLFPQRPAVQEKENIQATVLALAVKTKPTQLPSAETKKQTELTLTPEQLIRKHFDIEELKQEFENLDIESFELPNWSAKLQLRYKNNFIKDENVLLEHLRKWLRNSKHINLKSDISEI